MGQASLHVDVARGWRACVYVCVSIKLHITAQSGPVMLVSLSYSYLLLPIRVHV